LWEKVVNVTCKPHSLTHHLIITTYVDMMDDCMI